MTRQDPLAPTAAVLRRFITSRPNSAGGTWRPPRAPRGESRLVLAIARWCGHGPDAQLSHRSARTARAEPVPVGSTGPNERNGNDGPHSGPPCHVQVPPGAAAWAPCCGPRPAHPRPPAPAPAPQGAWLCLHGRGVGTRMLAAGHTAPFPLGVGLWQQEESAEGPGSGRRCWQGLGEAGHGVGPATRAQKEGLWVGAEARWEGPGSLRPWSCCPLDLRAGTSGRRGCRLRAHHTRMGSSVTCSCRHLTGSLPLSFQSPTGLAVLPRPSPRPLS